jgi:hypothetical protein
VVRRSFGIAAWWESKRKFGLEVEAAGIFGSRAM